MADLKFPYEKPPTNLPTTFCCNFMKTQLVTISEICEQHGWNCPDRVVSINSLGEYSLRAINAFYVLNYCPFCGKKLHDRI